MRTTKKAVETAKETKEEKKDLKPCLALWKNETKKGVYFTGKTEDGVKLVGFMQSDKKNEKAPDLTIYIAKEGKLTKDDKVASLWIQTAKTKKDYFTGLTNENEKLVGFISDGKNEKAPYINVYFKEEV